MALTDTKLRKLKPREQTFSESDGGGLFIEVTSSGKKGWGLRYRLAGKQEKARLGEYPAYSLAEARAWREDCAALVKRGLSPMALKRGDPIPNDAKPETREMAQTFLRNWCWQAVEKVRAKEAEAKVADTVEAFAWRWYAEVAEPGNSNPRNIKRVLEKDVIPAIGSKAACRGDRYRRAGDYRPHQGAGPTRWRCKPATSETAVRLCDCAGEGTFNPAAAVEAKFIATARSRDVALTPDEIGGYCGRSTNPA
jgi:hypothetical protein